MSRQIIHDQYGEFEIAVARHVNAPTFTFDLTVPARNAEPTPLGHVISCHNMTRADLEEHVRNCQAALAEGGGE